MVPKGWELKYVSDLVRFVGGSQPPKKTFSKESKKGYVRLIQTRDYKTDKYKIYIPCDLARRFCDKDDVMIGRYGPPVFQIYRGLKGAYNVALMKAEPRHTISKSYLYYFLCQDKLFRIIDRLSRRSAGQSGVDLSALRNFPFPLPPKQEREIIEKILIAWDSEITQLEELVSLKQQLKKGLMQKLLTGRRRFKSFKKKPWCNVTLKEFLIPQIRRIPKPSRPFLSIGIRSHGKGTFQKPDFDPNKIALTELYKVKTDDLIVNITFAWEGAIAIVSKWDEGALVSHRFPTYEFDRRIMRSEYFRHLILQKRFIYELGLVSPGGAGRNRVLNKKEFLKIAINIPSIEEQCKIASLLNGIDKEIDLLQQQLGLLKKQKRGLMQKLLSGQIRVKL